MSGNWPDDGAAYELPPQTQEAASAWQSAIDAALGRRDLRLLPAGDPYYDLVGKCPRCGHTFGQSLSFAVLVPAGDLLSVMADAAWRKPTDETATEGTFEIVCACRSKHEPFEDKQRGCGWGRGLDVTLTRPQPAPEAEGDPDAGDA